MNRLNTENINGLVSIYADNVQTAFFDADTSGNIYGTSLYINNQLINFGAYVTSSYLSSNYALISSLSNYVLSSTLSSTLNNYATNNALSSYRLISDSWSRGDTTNEILIRVGNMGTNSDGSITTAKQYTDNALGGLSAGIGVNSAAIAGLVAWQSATSATIGVLEGEIATLQGEVSGLETDVTSLQTKTQNQNASIGNTNFTGSVQINNLTTFGNDGSLTCNSVNVDTGTISALTTNVNYDQYIYSNSSVTVGNMTPGLGLSSINLNGIVFINGVALTPYSAASSFFSQW